MEGDIRGAVLQLLADVGYSALTMDLVAARAKTGKATLYRRWDGKAELVVDAVSCAEHELVPEPDTGTFRDDLYDLLRHLATLLRGPQGRIVTSLVSELPRHDKLASALQANFLAQHLPLIHRIAERGIARGDVRADAPWGLVLEIGSAMLLSRHLITGEPLTNGAVRELIDEVIMPLVRTTQPLETSRRAEVLPATA